ncbi:MAG: PIN domain-containing protein [Lachnospiraceae bacterium]|nr:PIN domain-containing protein [Lachnospiraceae bacterium]
MAYFLIDFENVKSDGMTGIIKLSAEDKVCIFYSEKADSLSFGMHKQLNETLAEVTYRKVEVGTRNALDFQLATCLGFLVANTLAEGGSNECFYVVSKDTGYVSLENYWKKNQKAKSAGIEVKRVTSIAAAVKLRKAESVEAAEPSVQPEKVQVSTEVTEKQADAEKEITEQPEKEAVTAKTEAGAASATEETVIELSQAEEVKESTAEPKEKPKKKKKSKLQHAEEKEKAAEKKKKQAKKRKMPKAEPEDRMVNEKLLGERIIGMYPETKEEAKPQTENVFAEKRKKRTVDAETVAVAEKQKRNSAAEMPEAAEQQTENPDAEAHESIKKQKRNPDVETTEDVKRKNRKPDAEGADSTERPNRKPASERKAKFKVRLNRTEKKSDHPEKSSRRRPENSQEQPKPVAEKPVMHASSEDGFSMVIREQNFVSSASADLSKYHVDEDFSKVTEQTHVANYHPGADTFQMKIETKGSGNQTIEQKQVVLSEQEENKN